MTPADIKNIRASFAVLSQDQDRFASEFYARLFATAPTVRSLFKADVSHQGKKLVGMLAVVVQGLDRLDTIVGAVQSLGERHAGYGVRDEHYDLVGAALIATLAIRLGPAFTPDVRASWIAAYALLSSVMRTAQAGVRQAA